MKLGIAIRSAALVAFSVGGIVTACHNDVPGPTLPNPIAPEVTREAPRPQPIDPKRKPRKVRVSHAPVDAGVSDVIDLPPNPDAAVTVVRDAGQPLK